jgi:hypothetical protein
LVLVSMPHFLRWMGWVLEYLFVFFKSISSPRLSNHEFVVTSSSFLFEYFWIFFLNLFGFFPFYRNKVLCGVWTWNTAHGRPLESHIWIVHGLCPKEPVLWDGDAYTMRALWHQPVSGNTEGSCCFIGAMNFPEFCFNNFVIFHFHLCICHEIFQFSFMLFFSLVAVCGCDQLAFHENLIFFSLNYFFSVFGLFWYVMSKINFKK